MNKCEICGSTKDLTTVSVKPCEYAQRTFSSCICKNCKTKYGTPYMQFFYADETVAQNLVREYGERKNVGSGLGEQFRSDL